MVKSSIRGGCGYNWKGEIFNEKGCWMIIYMDNLNSKTISRKMGFFKILTNEKVAIIVERILKYARIYQ